MQEYKYSIPMILGGVLLSTMLGKGIIVNNAFAEGVSSYFDPNAVECVIDNYNTENGTHVTEIDDVDFERITTLNCSSRGITNLYGLVLLTNLEHLDISNNASLIDLDFSYNTKLKTINVKGIGTSYFDFINNTDLESIETDRDITLNTVAYVEKSNDSDKPFRMDMSALKFVGINEMTWTDRQYITNVPYPFTVDDTILHYIIVARSGSMRFEVYFEGEEEVESHNAYCWKSLNYFNCDNTVYHGEEFDSDEIIEDLLSNVFDLDEYEIKKVEIASPATNVQLSTSTNTLKKGKVLADASFILRFYFGAPSAEDANSNIPSVPDTGINTNEEGGSKEVLTFLALGGVLCALYIIAIVPRILKNIKG